MHAGHTLDKTTEPHSAVQLAVHTDLGLQHTSTVAAAMEASWTDRQVMPV
jgi:hypothetical protein